MNLEDIAFKMFKRQSETLCDDPQDIDFIWQMDDGIRNFWLDEAEFVSKLVTEDM